MSYLRNGWHRNSGRSQKKDLGVTIVDNLKTSVHCAHQYAKANRMLGLLRRTFKTRSKPVLLKMYKSVVRPHLEYCSSVWSPYYKKDKELLEKIQHGFTRLFKELRQLTYAERVHVLGLWSLEERRNQADLVEVYKMIASQLYQQSNFLNLTQIVEPEVTNLNWRNVSRPRTFDSTFSPKGSQIDGIVSRRTLYLQSHSTHTKQDFNKCQTLRSTSSWTSSPTSRQVTLLQTGSGCTRWITSYFFSLFHCIM